MVRRTTIALVALFTLALTPRAVPAHEGHDHKIMGTVTVAAADHLVLEDRDGKAITIKVTKDTKVKSKSSMKLQEIRVGTRVVVTATQAKDKTFTAKTVEARNTPPERPAC
jgi:hypothetical protein